MKMKKLDSKTYKISGELIYSIAKYATTRDPLEIPIILEKIIELAEILGKDLKIQKQ